MEDETFNVPLKGNFEDFANDERQAEEILVGLERHKSSYQNVDIINQIENDLPDEPQRCNYNIKDAPLRFQPFTNLSSDDHPLNCGSVIASCREGQIELE